jgi:uncharacterized oligopeptide transporter (OPT) family protein
MTTPDPAAPAALHDDAPKKPSGVRELTFRSVTAALVVAAIIGASYPYIVMKLGFGPNISVVSAFFGFLALGLVFKDYNRWENNIVQAAGTSAGQTAFLCVLMAAFDMLAYDPAVRFPFRLSHLQAFLWLTTAGVLGVLMAVPLRRHYILDEKLTFADGVAAGETLIVLDSRGEEGRAAARSMGLASVGSAIVMGMRADARLLRDAWYRIHEMIPFGPLGGKMNMGVALSLLNVGAGMLVGMRVNTSMMLGTLLSWQVAPPLLLQYGGIDELLRRKVLLWVMWPATGMLVAGGLTALVLKWNVLARSLGSVGGARVSGDEFPMKGVVIGSLASAAGLVAVQHFMLGTPVWMTLLAIAVSGIFMLVGLRVLGETNWGPISALSNMMQGVFGALAPGNIVANMTSSGVTGSIVAQSEGIMQNYKTGHMIGSTPRYLTWAQLMAVPVGAITVAYTYPLLRDTYGLAGGPGGDLPSAMQSPISQKWAGFAKLLSGGLSALPKGAVEALAIGAALGIVFTLLEGTKLKKWVPSPTGIGIGMLVPGSAIMAMFVGGLFAETWKKLSRRSAERYVTPVASGFIAGEAIVAVLIPILVALGLLHLQR